MVELASIVLFAGDLDRTVGFYRALGVPLDDEDHGDRVIHAAAELGAVHVAVFPADAAGAAPPWRGAGSTFTGLYVPSLETAVAATEPFRVAVLIEHEPRSWGCRAVLRDPDGRAVEVNQRGHCRADRN